MTATTPIDEAMLALETRRGDDDGRDSDWQFESRNVFESRELGSAPFDSGGNPWPGAAGAAATRMSTSALEHRLAGWVTVAADDHADLLDGAVLT